jgi:hypothetical protein
MMHSQSLYDWRNTDSRVSPMNSSWLKHGTTMDIFVMADLSLSIAIAFARHSKRREF